MRRWYGLRGSNIVALAPEDEQPSRLGRIILCRLRLYNQGHAREGQCLRARPAELGCQPRQITAVGDTSTVHAVLPSYVLGLLRNAGRIGGWRGCSAVLSVGAVGRLRLLYRFQ